MQVPPEIAFRHLEATDDLREVIREGIDRLDEAHPNLISCRIMVADDTPAQQSGSNFRARLDLSVPGSELVVEEDNGAAGSDRSAARTLKDAFSVARRRLQKEKSRHRDHAAGQALPPHGRVVRLLTDETGVRYGFILTRDGRRVYFHEDALVDLAYEELETGDEVHLAIAGGDDGPQASTVSPLPDDALGPRREKDVPLRS